MYPRFTQNKGIYFVLSQAVSSSVPHFSIFGVLPSKNLPQDLQKIYPRFTKDLLSLPKAYPELIQHFSIYPEFT